MCVYVCIYFSFDLFVFGYIRLVANNRMNTNNNTPVGNA